MIVLNAFQMHSQVRKWFGHQTSVTLPDRNYALPDKRWVLNDFYPWYKKELMRLGGQEWSEAWDCDDFARMFACLMQLSHRNAVGRGEAKESFAEGIACAEIHYHMANGTAHAINAIITKEGGEIKPVFIEPQTGMIEPVPDNSIWYTRF